MVATETVDDKFESILRTFTISFPSTSSSISTTTTSSSENVSLSLTISSDQTIHDWIALATHRLLENLKLPDAIPESSCFGSAITLSGIGSFIFQLDGENIAVWLFPTIDDLFFTCYNRPLVVSWISRNDDDDDNNNSLVSENETADQECLRLNTSSVFEKNKSFLMRRYEQVHACVPASRPVSPSDAMVVSQTTPFDWRAVTFLHSEQNDDSREVSLSDLLANSGICKSTLFFGTDTLVHILDTVDLTSASSNIVIRPSRLVSSSALSWIPMAVSVAYTGGTVVDVECPSILLEQENDKKDVQFELWGKLTDLRAFQEALQIKNDDQEEEVVNEPLPDLFNL